MPNATQQPSPRAGQYPDQYTRERAAIVAEAQQQAREAREAVERSSSQIDAIKELIAYSLGIVLFILLIVLMLTPAT